MAVIAVPKTTVRKPAVKKTTVKAAPVKRAVPNDGDKIAVTIVGRWDAADNCLIVGDRNGRSEDIYIDWTDIPWKDHAAYDVLEVEPLWADGDVIKDAEGCVFIRKNGDWKGLGSSYDHCSEPNRPFTLATFG